MKLVLRVFIGVAILGLCISVLFLYTERNIAIPDMHIKGAAAHVPIATQLGEPAASILKWADRVEVFRVGEKAGDNGTKIDTCPVAYNGNDQNVSFAIKLSSVLLADTSYDSYQDLCVIDPAVIFRLWHGKQHVDAIVCFKCNEIQIATDLPSGEQQYLLDGNFSPARDKLLALAKRALPEDKEIRELR